MVHKTVEIWIYDFSNSDLQQLFLTSKNVNETKKRLTAPKFNNKNNK